MYLQTVVDYLVVDCRLSYLSSRLYNQIFVLYLISVILNLILCLLILSNDSKMKISIFVSNPNPKWLIIGKLAIVIFQTVELAEHRK